MCDSTEPKQAAHTQPQLLRLGSSCSQPKKRAKSDWLSGPAQSDGSWFRPCASQMGRAEARTGRIQGAKVQNSSKLRHRSKSFVDALLLHPARTKAAFHLRPRWKGRPRGVLLRGSSRCLWGRTAGTPSAGPGPTAAQRQHPVVGVAGCARLRRIGDRLDQRGDNLSKTPRT